MASNKSKTMAQYKMKEFDVSNITFDKLQKNQNGGNFTNLLYNDKKGFSFQLPNVICYGPQMFPNQQSGQEDWSITISFRKQDMENDKSIKEAVEKIRELEEHIKKELLSKSKEYFKTTKKLSMDTIDAYFNPLLKESKDSDGLPDGRQFYFKIKLSRPKNKETGELLDTFMSDFYVKEKDEKGNRKLLEDEEGNSVNTKNIGQLIPKYSKIKCTIRPGMFWFIGANKCGLSVTINQAVVEPSESYSKVCTIESSSDEEDNTSDGEDSDSDE